MVSHSPKDNQVLHQSEKCCNSIHSKGMFSINNLIRITLHLQEMLRLQHNSWSLQPSSQFSLISSFLSN